MRCCTLIGLFDKRVAFDEIHQDYWINATKTGTVSTDLKYCVDIADKYIESTEWHI